MSTDRLKRTLFTNTAFQFFSRFIAASLAFLVTTLIIRLGGISLYGDYLKVITLLSFNYFLVDLGLNAVVVRYLNHPSSVSHHSQLFHTLTSLRFLIAFVSATLTLAWLFLLAPPSYSPSIKLAFLFSLPTIFFLGLKLSANAWFQHQLAYHKTALINLLGALAFLVSASLALYLSPHLTPLILAYSFGFFASALSALYLLRLPLSPSFSFTPTISLLLQSTWLSLIFLFSSFASKIDIFIASFFRSSNDIGQYGFAYRLFEFAILLPTLFMNVVYPLLLRSRHPQSQKRLFWKTTLLLFFLSLLISLSLFFLSPLILFFKPTLTLSFYWFRLLLLSLPLFYLTPPLMWYLITLRHERLLSLVYFLALLLNLFLNLYFIPRFGLTAATLITLFTELFIFLSLLLILALAASPRDTIKSS